MNPASDPADQPSKPDSPLPAPSNPAPPAAPKPGSPAPPPASAAPGSPPAPGTPPGFVPAFPAATPIPSSGAPAPGPGTPKPPSSPMPAPPSSPLPSGDAPPPAAAKPFPAPNSPLPAPGSTPSAAPSPPPPLAGTPAAPTTSKDAPTGAFPAPPKEEEPEAKPEAVTTEESPAKKSKFKPVLVAAIVLLLLAVMGLGAMLAWKRLTGGDGSKITMQGGMGTMVTPPQQTGSSGPPVPPAPPTPAPTGEPGAATSPAPKPTAAETTELVSLRSGSDGWSDYDLSGVRVSVPGKLQRDAQPVAIGNPPGADTLESFNSVFGGVRIRISKTTLDAGPSGKPLLDQLAKGFEETMKDTPSEAKPRIGRAGFDFRGNPAQRIWTRFGTTGRYADVWHVVKAKDLVTVSVSGTEKEAREVSERLMKSLSL